MKIEGVDISLNQSGIFVIEPTDSVQRCFIQVTKSEGVEQPIVIKSGPALRFQYNIINSEIPGPILLDGKPWPGIGDNYFHLAQTD